MESPTAPSSITSRISAFMFAGSLALAGLFSQPMASFLTGELPRM